jgi:hypothetical protein
MALLIVFISLADYTKGSGDDDNDDNDDDKDDDENGDDEDDGMCTMRERVQDATVAPQQSRRSRSSGKV